jgi:putative redox protein
MQTATVKWIGEQKFLTTSPSGHSVPFDSDRQSNTATGPMEMLLMALGACTATDIVIILEKKRQKIVQLEVFCSGERAAESPKVWTRLDVRFRISGFDETGATAAQLSTTKPIDDSAMRHAMKLTAEKYCSVAAMLEKTAAFSWHYEIVPAA